MELSNETNVVNWNFRGHSLLQGLSEACRPIFTDQGNIFLSTLYFLIHPGQMNDRGLSHQHVGHQETTSVLQPHLHFSDRSTYLGTNNEP